jgi:uncharacterized protein DUF3800
VCTIIARGNAFGGGPLEGRKVVRFIFTDEGGISRFEPFVVVAGIFVHGDEQLVPLENEIERLVQKHIPKEDQPDFVFHATDIWSGTGKIFKDKEKWPLPRRLAILHDLARVPRKLGVPIVYEATERGKLDFLDEEQRAQRKVTPFEHHVGAHAITFAACTLRIEQLMRVKWPREIAQIVAEDNDQVRALVKGAHETFRDPSKAGGKLVANDVPPLKKIRGSVHFASKGESSPLQLADLCAFLIRGHLARHPHNGPLYDRIKLMMLLQPADAAYRGPKITASPPYVARQITWTRDS